MAVGRVDVTTATGGGVTVNVIPTDWWPAEGSAESVTAATPVYVPAVVGVPASSPEGCTVMPGGSAPDCSDQL